MKPGHSKFRERETWEGRELAVDEFLGEAGKSAFVGSVSVRALGFALID